MADWSQLPDQLVISIATRLDVIEDFVTFISVCRSWRMSTPKSCWSPGPHQFPWLMLANKDESDDTTRGFFSLNRNKRYDFKLPEIHGRRCWGSSIGWVITLGLDKTLQLFNPLTRNLVHLPSIYPLVDHPNLLYAKNWKDDDFLKNFVDKAFVVKKSSACGNGINNIIVVVIYGCYEHMAFARPSDQYWTLLPTGTTCTDVVSYRDQIFTLTGCRRVLVLDIISKDVKDLCIPPLEHSTDICYLVESAGDIFMIERDTSDEERAIYNELYDIPKIERDIVDEHDYDVRPLTYDFDIYRLNLESKTWELIEWLDDLGDQAFFLGNSSSMSCNACHVTTETNYIYFTDDVRSNWRSWEGGGGGADMGICNYKNKNILSLYVGDDTLSNISPPVWMMPSLC